MSERTLSEIAKDIRSNWPKVNYAAEPYLQAMGRMRSVSDSFGHDDGKGIVIRFLGNATSWRGPEARRIKAELKKLAGIK